MQAFAKRLLLHERFAEAHVHAAFDLAFHEQRVDRASDVVRDPDLVDANQAGARVGVDVDDARRVAVGGAWSDAGALVGSGDLRRRVAARGRQGAEPRLSQHAGLFEGDVIEPAAACFYRFDQQRAHLACRFQGGVAGHEGDPGRVRAEVDRGRVGVGCHQPDVRGLQPELFGDDGREHRIGALADFHRSAVRGDAAAVDLDLNLGVRHVVPVDGGAGAGQVGRDRKAHSMPGALFAGLDHLKAHYRANASSSARRVRTHASRRR